MSEYWKSTPKYWCKHCSTYVRDTKLERANHEATAKHKSGLKRFLRDLHRGHENEQRDKDRAKQEIDRLNGLTSKPSASSSASSAAATSTTTAAATATPAQRQQQWEQLAEMGINVPTELRRDMALVGEWTVTNTRVIDDAPDPAVDDDDGSGDQKPAGPNTTTTGVRKRPKQEDEDDKDEEGEAVKGLFKKPRRWGRDTKHIAEDNAELDALLGIPLVKPPLEEEEEAQQPTIKDDSSPNIKTEDLELDGLLSGISVPVNNEQIAEAVKKEEQDQEPADPVIVFKKRKPKNIRQK
ncbi:putative u1 zinc finger domain-containing protein [Rosellinia necatrix]|uniref:Putative u1 zinc finger domain-containing protein n=1 Tax=Rosellinia necatrix TaxID=77044 RepID=A0A1W2TFD2_ROSNE|nr:putative u1 zinc finger domain-containing protein [Rosellinia necatrix]